MLYVEGLSPVPSHEGYHYVFFIVDHATKMCRVLTSCIGGLLWTVPSKTVLYVYVYGAAPDLKWLRICGCKCYALKADWQKTSTKRPIQDSFWNTLHSIPGSIWLSCRHSILILCRCTWCLLMPYPIPSMTTKRSSSGLRMM